MAPLDNIIVLDLSLLLPGPLATQILRDLGAKVTKIEPPFPGDYMAAWPPKIGQQSAMYLALNRGKQIESIDLKDISGCEKFEKMVVEADVIVEGFRPGVLDKLGFGYGRLSDLNHRIVLCSISGFGQSGPYSQRAGHDLGYQAVCGALSMAGGDAPANPCLQVADTAAGSYAACMLIIAALLERERTGRGRHIDISMSEQLLPLMTAYFAAADAQEGGPTRDGATLTGGAPCYRIYQTSDCQQVTLGALEPKFWRAVVERLGRPELANAPFLGGPGHENLEQQLSTLFASKTRQQWEDIFRDADACFEPVLTLTEVRQHPQWLARGSFTRLQVTAEKALTLPKMPGSLAGFDTPEEQGQ